MKIASMVLGILAFLCCYIPVVNILLALAALIVSIIALKKKENLDEAQAAKDKKERVYAKVGLGFSIFSIIISIIITVCLILFTKGMFNYFEKFGANPQKYLNIDYNATKNLIDQASETLNVLEENVENLNEAQTIVNTQVQSDLQQQAQNLIQNVQQNQPTPAELQKQAQDLLDDLQQ